MIRVRKAFDNPPRVLLDATTTRKLEAVLLSKRGQDIVDRYNHADVLEALRATYHGKCAYCEVLIHSHTPQVEHYRPKAMVTSGRVRNGYYWLGFEWSNLLLSCSLCNGNKRNQFPIAGHPMTEPPNAREEWRATSQAAKAEKALLIHPELDNPALHLRFKPNGTLEGLDNRGKTTIAVCGLNRSYLELGRKRLVDEFFATYSSQFLHLVEHVGLEKFTLLIETSPVIIARETLFVFKTCFHHFEKRAAPVAEFSSFAAYAVTHIQTIAEFRLPEVEFQLFHHLWSFYQEDKG